MRTFLALFLFVAAAAGLVTTARAVTASGPVRVASCIVFSRSSPNSVLTPNVDLTNGVQVTLVNDSDKTTSSVTVTGNYHGRTVTDSAKLTMKPGASVTIARSYYPPSTYIDADAKCRVVHVDFADGTSWSAP
ncbi:MAG TPA: hypothetical protein VMD07_00680 [Candidatus Acidoferrales bacterium]|nr:hypothetical protein [Candidatus Acidoferrales bacterium]